jgi:hypothetical protein
MNVNARLLLKVSMKKNHFCKCRRCVEKVKMKTNVKIKQ